MVVVVVVMVVVAIPQKRIVGMLARMKNPGNCDDDTLNMQS